MATRLVVAAMVGLAVLTTGALVGGFTDAVWVETFFEVGRSFGSIGMWTIISGSRLLSLRLSGIVSH